MAPDPFEQALQHDLVLLDDEEPRALLRRDGQMLGDLSVEVAVVGAVGRAVRLDLEVAPVLADADQLDDVAGGGGLVTPLGTLSATSASEMCSLNGRSGRA